MNSEIPEEITREARRLASLVDLSPGDLAFLAKEYFGPALLARDQRAPEIAHLRGKQLGEPAIGHACGESILTYDKAQQ